MCQGIGQFCPIPFRFFYLLSATSNCNGPAEPAQPLIPISATTQLAIHNMFQRTLNSPQKALLLAIADGATLKAHRDLEGRKVHRLHALDGTAVSVESATVDLLKRRRLIDSNKKFPAATYLLTEKGQRLAAMLSGRQIKPLGSRRYGKADER